MAMFGSSWFEDDDEDLTMGEILSRRDAEWEEDDDLTMGERMAKRDAECEGMYED